VHKAVDEGFTAMKLKVVLPIRRDIRRSNLRAMAVTI